MVKIIYDECKATEIAAYFLEQAGREMPYLKLLKLMYLAERKSFTRCGQSLTHDTFCSMKNGPVLCSTYDLIKGQNKGRGYWIHHINIEKYQARLKTLPHQDSLSIVEKAILKSVQSIFGSWNMWEIVAFTHGLPEYIDSGGSSVIIKEEDILKAVGYSDPAVNISASEKND